MRASLATLVYAAVIAVPAIALAASKNPHAGSAAGPDTAIVHLGSADGGTNGFVAWPSEHNPSAGVVVAFEWWGLNGEIRGLARRLSREGYVAIVPDLYHGKVPSDPEQAHELSRALEDEGALVDLQSAVTWLRQQPSMAKRRVGVIGFCMGGGLSQRLALHSPQISAAVMFYGVPETDPQALRALAGPLQAHFGATDQGIPPSRAEDLKKALKAAGKVGEVYVYPGAGHAFMNETRPSYAPDAARQAWARTLAFFQ